MRKLIEATHVSLGGEIGALDWVFPYLDEEHLRYSAGLLADADALLLGRKTFDSFAVSYPAMAEKVSGDMRDFVARMNGIEKFVVTRNPTELPWNGKALSGDLVEAVRELKDRPGGTLLKYGTGELDPVLLEHRLVDEYHFWLAPVAAPAAVQPLFTGVEGAPPLELLDVTSFKSGVVALRYKPSAG